MLFTDASNPTSNAIYERLGFRHVADVVDLDTVDGLKTIRGEWRYEEAAVGAPVKKAGAYQYRVRGEYHMLNPLTVSKMPASEAEQIVARLAGNASVALRSRLVGRFWIRSCWKLVATCAVEIQIFCPDST